MSQVSLYLDDETMAKLKSDAKSTDCSLSKYVAQLIKDSSPKPAWPEGFWSLYGSLSDVKLEEPDDLPVERALDEFDDFAQREY